MIASLFTFASIACFVWAFHNEYEPWWPKRVGRLVLSLVLFNVAASLQGGLVDVAINPRLSAIEPR